MLVYQKEILKELHDPLSKFGAVTFNLMSKIQRITINYKRFGQSLKPIKYIEVKGSAQCKSSIIFAGMRTDGKTIDKSKKIKISFTETFM